MTSLVIISVFNDRRVIMDMIVFRQLSDKGNCLNSSIVKIKDTI